MIYLWINKLDHNWCFLIPKVKNKDFIKSMCVRYELDPKTLIRIRDNARIIRIRIKSIDYFNLSITNNNEIFTAYR